MTTLLIQSLAIVLNCAIQAVFVRWFWNSFVSEFEKTKLPRITWLQALCLLLIARNFYLFMTFLR